MSDCSFHQTERFSLSFSLNLLQTMLPDEIANGSHAHTSGLPPIALSLALTRRDFAQLEVDSCLMGNFLRGGCPQVSWPTNSLRASIRIARGGRFLKAVNSAGG